MIDVFISYAQEDRQAALRLFGFLASNGYTPWMDKKNLLPGVNWEREILRAVDKADICVFLLSEHSVRKRGFFQREMNLALDKALSLLDDDISIIPVKIADCEAPEKISKFQWLDCTQNLEFRELLPSLKLAAEQQGRLGPDNAQSGPIVEQYVQTEESTGSYHISIYYPSFVFPGDPDLSRSVNSIIAGDINKSVMRFRLESGENELTYPDSKHGLTLSMSPVFSSRSVVSCVEHTWTFFSGAAHGNGFRSSLNIDIRDRTLFDTGDIIQNDEGIIDLMLREYARLEKDLGPSIVDLKDVLEILKNSLCNKSHFSTDGIVALFDQYEIFCYASGPFEILIPNRLLLDKAGYCLNSRGKRLSSVWL